MTPRSEYFGTLLLLVAGGGLGLLASSRVWGSGMAASSLSPSVEEVTGNDLVPLASGVSLVALAAVVVVPAVRRLGRRIVGGVLILLGGGVAIATWMVAVSLDQRILDWIGSDPASSGADSSVGEVSSSPLWAVALLVAGLLIWGAGVLVAVRGSSWPAMGVRYERPAARPRDAWDALDRGDDPSAEP